MFVWELSHILVCGQRSMIFGRRQNIPSLVLVRNVPYLRHGKLVLELVVQLDGTPSWERRHKQFVEWIGKIEQDYKNKINIKQIFWNKQ